MKSSALSSHALAFIGAGNMAEAIIRGLCAAKVVAPRNIIASDPRPGQRAALKKNYKIRTVADNSAAIRSATIVFLAVKPQMMETVLPEIASALTNKQLVISIAAGISTTYIEKFLPTKTPVVRVMPNTPALVLCAMTGIAKGRWATPRHLRIAQTVFEALGAVIVVPEPQIDAITAVSGSGPAYFFYIAEAMTAAARGLGFSQSIAQQLVTQTLVGAGMMLSHGDEDAATLRKKVTSPGGTTEAALKVFDTNKLKSIFGQALLRAYQRAQELKR